MVIYLDENTIIAAKRTIAPRSGRTVTGYGKHMPTRYMIQLANKRWYRVYAICYSNVASWYITMKNGGDRFIDNSCHYVMDKIATQEY
jgi:hypothetical protein